MKIQIHRQKSRIARDIKVAEAVVELDAVIDMQCVIRHVDVIEMQVAMAIADPALRHAPGK